MGMTGYDAIQNALRQKPKPTITTGTSFEDWNAGEGPGQINTGTSFEDWNAAHPGTPDAPPAPDPQPVKYGSSGYDADLQAQMDAIFYAATGGRRAPRQDEYD